MEMRIKIEEMTADEIESIAERLRKIGIETYIDMCGPMPVLHTMPAPF